MTSSTAYQQHAPYYQSCWLCCLAGRRYEAAKKTGEYDGEQRRRENAKHSLERYMHYFERWDAHNKVRRLIQILDSEPSHTERGSSLCASVCCTGEPCTAEVHSAWRGSWPLSPDQKHVLTPAAAVPLLSSLQARDKARKDAAQFEAESLEQLSDMTKTPTSQLKFIKDAWRQVRRGHCIRTLIALACALLHMSHSVYGCCVPWVDRGVTEERAACIACMLAPCFAGAVPVRTRYF